MYLVFLHQSLLSLPFLLQDLFLLLLVFSRLLTPTSRRALYFIVHLFTCLLLQKTQSKYKLAQVYVKV